MSLQSLIFLPTIFAIFLLTAISHSDDSSARSMIAFCQHYALSKENYKILSPDVANPWSDCEKEIRRDFPGATTILEAFLVNPEAFINHLTRHAHPSNVLYNLIGMVRPLNYYENFTAAFIILCSYSLSLVLTTILLGSFRELFKQFVGFIQDNRNLFIVSSCGLFATIPGFIIYTKSAYLLPSLPFFALLAGGFITCAYKIVMAKIKLQWIRWFVHALSVLPVGVLLIIYISTPQIYPVRNRDYYQHISTIRRIIMSNPDLRFSILPASDLYNIIYYVPHLTDTSTSSIYTSDVILLTPSRLSRLSDVRVAEEEMSHTYVGFGMLVKPEHVPLIAEQIISILQESPPEGVLLSPDVQGIFLDFGSGWYNFEPTYNGRWMAQEGTLHILSTSHRTVWLHVTPVVMSEDGQRFGSRGELTIHLNGNLLRTLNIVSGQPILLPLWLVPGNNVVTLQLKAPAYNQYQHGHSPDGRDLGVFFTPLELLADARSIPLDNLPQDQLVHEPHLKDRRIIS